MPNDSQAAMSGNHRDPAESAGAVAIDESNDAVGKFRSGRAESSPREFWVIHAAKKSQRKKRALNRNCCGADFAPRPHRLVRKENES
jgi:hypothetical protein